MTAVEKKINCFLFLEKKWRRRANKDFDFVIEELQIILIEDKNLYQENSYDNDGMKNMFQNR